MKSARRESQIGSFFVSAEIPGSLKCSLSSGGAPGAACTCATASPHLSSSCCRTSRLVALLGASANRHRPWPNLLLDRNDIHARASASAPSERRNRDNDDGPTNRSCF